MTLLDAVFSIFARLTRQDRLEAAGRAAIAEAQRLFDLDVTDPAPGSMTASAIRSRRVIDELLTACGWSWAVPYAGDGKGPQWCGITAGACWRKAGLDPKWLATFWPSTYRLACFFNYQPFDPMHQNKRPANGPYRIAEKIEPNKPLAVEPRAGDILIVGNGKKREGDHVTLLASYDKARGVWSTLSGNGGGLGPDGKRREGIVKADYAAAPSAGRYHAMWLYRPALSDLVPA